LAIDYTSPLCRVAEDSSANWLESRDCHSSGIFIGCPKNLNLTYFNRFWVAPPLAFGFSKSAASEVSAKNASTLLDQ